ncbi:MAG: sarcosine oxidase subunit gamma [Pseudomonadota bacterium]
MPYDAAVIRLPVLALFDLQGTPEALSAWATSLPGFPDQPNTLTRAGPDELCHVGPNRWLLRSAIDREDALQASLRPDEAPPEISIVPVSDTLTFFRVTGPDALNVLSIGCPLDLHPDMFGPDAVSYTEFFGLRALVLRCTGGFDIAVEQSYGDMIADCLSRAMA